MARHGGWGATGAWLPVILLALAAVVVVTGWRVRRRGRIRSEPTVAEVSQ
jgi:hypothetical protein